MQKHKYMAAIINTVLLVGKKFTAFAITSCLG